VAKLRGKRAGGGTVVRRVNKALVWIITGLEGPTMAPSAGLCCLAAAFTVADMKLRSKR